LLAYDAVRISSRFDAAWEFSLRHHTPLKVLAWILCILFANPWMGCSKKDQIEGPAEEKTEGKQAESQIQEEAALEEAEPEPEAPTRRRGPSVDLTEITPDRIEGTLVRCFRRNISSGIIQLYQERVADIESAAMRLASLRSLGGWKSWPPSAAPELSISIAAYRPEFRECPYLMEITKLPNDALSTPSKEIGCFQDLEQVEAGLVREELIAYVLEQATPCGELRLKAVADDDTRLRVLRDRCKVFGINFLARQHKHLSEDPKKKQFKEERIKMQRKEKDS
jgi:hypothetical protein